jgi:hypothetical protein
MVRIRQVPVKFTAIYFFGVGLVCVGHFLAYVAHFEFLRDVWIQTQRAAIVSRRAKNLATHLSTIYLVGVFVDRYWQTSRLK